MTAYAIRPAPPSRRLGMKILSAVLTVVCAIELLIAFERVRPPSEWRVAAVEAPALPELDFPVIERPVTLAWRAIEGALWPAPVLTADPADVVLAGRFVAQEADGTLRGAAFEGALIRLDDGVVLRTRPWRIAAGAETFAQGQTFARRLAAAPDAQIELRQVVSDEAGAPVAASPLCGGEAPGKVALLHRQDQVDLMLFRAGATPGPDAPASALCGAWTLRRE